MQSSDILSPSYTPVGDSITIILCLVLFVLIKVTYMKEDYKFFLIKHAIYLLVIAGSSNIAFSVFAERNMPSIYLYVANGIYHIALMFMFVIYIAYLMCVVGNVGKQSMGHIYVSMLVASVFVAIECVAAELHLDFYKDAQGVWHRGPFLTPFTVVYMLNIVIVSVVIWNYRKKIVKKIFYTILLIQMACVFIAFVGKLCDQKSYLTLTFYLPVLIMLFLFHSNSFQVGTGARDFTAFTYYLEERARRNKKDCFLCLELYLEDGEELPKFVENAFYSFYQNIFSGAELFSSNDQLYVLTIPQEKDDNVMERIEVIIREKFAREYNKHHIPYKMFLIPQHSIKDIDSFKQMSRFFFKHMEECSYKVLVEKDLEEYAYSCEIISQLRDIHEKKNLDDERVVVYCQPIKNVVTGKFDIAEMLMRLELPGLGMIYPNDFISLAEEYHYIHTLSNVMLHKCCKATKHILEAGFEIERVSVNFSIMELGEGEFMKDFTSIVEDAGVGYRYIGVELTESTNDKDYEMVASIVRQLKALQVMLYLDDFGTGYSNLDRILGLDFDVIKFDRNLLLMSEKEEKTKMLLAYLAGAFHDFGFTVLYEGVETVDQESYCIQCHADYLQGYKFSRPIPIFEWKEFLIQHNR